MCHKFKIIMVVHYLYVTKGQSSREVEFGPVSEIDGTLICENLNYLMKKNANFSHLTLKLSIL